MKPLILDRITLPKNWRLVYDDHTWQAQYRELTIARYSSKTAAIIYVYKNHRELEAVMDKELNQLNKLIDNHVDDQP